MCVLLLLIISLIVVFFSFIFLVIIILTGLYHARNTLIPAREVGLTDGDYAFIMFELDHDGVFIHKEHPSSWFTFVTNESDPYFRCKFQQAFESVLMIAVNVKENKEGEFKKFQRAVVKRSPEKPFPNRTIYEGHLFDNPGLPLKNATPVSSQMAFYSFFRLIIKSIWDCPILK